MKQVLNIVRSATRRGRRQPAEGIAPDTTAPLRGQAFDKVAFGASLP
jgi:hypothetical protein